MKKIANYKNNSVMNTIPQQMQATGKSPSPKYETTIPTTSAIIPAIGDCVASIIAGKVITASVT